MNVNSLFPFQSQCRNAKKTKHNEKNEKKRKPGTQTQQQQNAVFFPGPGNTSHSTSSSSAIAPVCVCMNTRANHQDIIFRENAPPPAFTSSSAPSVPYSSRDFPPTHSLTPPPQTAQPRPAAQA